MKHSYLQQAEPEAIEQLYRDYLADPMSVEPGWRRFFEGFEFARLKYDDSAVATKNVSFEFRVMNLITDYRQRGHLFTLTNPVRQRRKYSPTLDIENYGLSEQDLNTTFNAGNELGIGKASLHNILAVLKQTYCRTIGAEFMFIRNREIIAFLLQKMESTRNTPSFVREEKLQILTILAETVFFEQFLHRRFPGQKRFSLQGAEAIVPALETVIKTGSQYGANEFILGMAHRGRVNVLANIMKKPVSDIFGEFMNKEVDDELLLGDVKYHLGFTSKRTITKDQEIFLALCPNPSHLEAVNPVVEGIARSRTDHLYNGDTSKVVPVLIHGDAAIAGQGIVYEVLQMSGLEGYSTGGTIHIVINNQIGFTTNYPEARTSIYCTDVAKTIQSPVFHVNGDDVEAVVFCIQLAMEFRARFNKDVFIDLLCYRKYGHNEGDEPRFTQPLLYKAIENHPDPFVIYSQKLVAANDFTHEEIKTIEQATIKRLEDAFTT
ncbi:MAG TPA: thiamine pyrophosphate-dependent enzyme, partial [Bacteroidales bacterium]|nr:thiamine pyrophosphate-dependent enzyme [Bacteroidales bacterium]